MKKGKREKKIKLKTEKEYTGQNKRNNGKLSGINYM
jgi:hypothetical protein